MELEAIEFRDLPSIDTQLRCVQFNDGPSLKQGLRGLVAVVIFYLGLKAKVLRGFEEARHWCGSAILQQI